MSDPVHTIPPPLPVADPEDDLPMTMQVAMIAADGIVLASDLKWFMPGDDRHGPFRHSEYRSKIKVDREIAICCAGNDMTHATQVADKILLHWREGEGTEVQRIQRIVVPLFKKRDFQCLIALAAPVKKLIYVRDSKVAIGIGSRTEWSRCIAPVHPLHVAGDQANDAKFWLRYYDPSLTVEELKGLAAHLVVEAQNFNNAMIGGLEVVVTDGSCFTPISEDECQALEAEAKKRAREIGELVLCAAPKSPPHDGRAANLIDIPCPKCSAVLGSADPAFRLLRFPSISCSCGFTGPYDWVNPQLGISVAEAVAQLECRKTEGITRMC